MTSWLKSALRTTLRATAHEAHARAEVVEALRAAFLGDAVDEDALDDARNEADAEVLLHVLVRNEADGAALRQEEENVDEGGVVADQGRMARLGHRFEEGRAPGVESAFAVLNAVEAPAKENHARQDAQDQFAEPEEERRLRLRKVLHAEDQREQLEQHKASHQRGEGQQGAQREQDQTAEEEARLAPLGKVGAREGGVLGVDARFGLGQKGVLLEERSHFPANQRRVAGVQREEDGAAHDYRRTRG